jgi:putative membrane protein
MRKHAITLISAGMAILSACGNSDQKAKQDADTTLKTSDTTITKTSKAVALDTVDVSFFQNAAYGGMVEVESSNKIIQLTTDSAIKNFAQMMVKDHGQANLELKSLANAKGYILPAALPGSKIDLIRKIESFNNEGRDEYYVQLMMMEHKNAVNLFSAGSKSHDPEISKFASTLLPKLNAHLQHVMKLDTAQIAPRANQGDDPLKISDRKKQQQ